MQAARRSVVPVLSTLSRNTVQLAMSFRTSAAWRRRLGGWHKAEGNVDWRPICSAARLNDPWNGIALSRYLLVAGIAVAVVLVSSDVLCAQAPKKDIEITIPNMHCESCAKKIRSQLFTVKGVSKVTTYVGENRAVVVPSAGKTLSVYVLWDKLEQADFAPSKIVTPTAEYTEKPPVTSGALQINR